MNKSERPVIKIELATTDKIAEAVGGLLLVTLWVVALFYYSKLPDTIPTHYNISGQADDHGSKATVFLLPVFVTVLFLLLTFLNKFPRSFNYPAPITAENAKIQYTMGTRLLRYLKIAMIFSFLILQGSVIKGAKTGAEGLGLWFIPVNLGLILLPIIIFLPKMLKGGKSNK